MGDPAQHAQAPSPLSSRDTPAGLFAEHALAHRCHASEFATSAGTRSGSEHICCSPRAAIKGRKQERDEARFLKGKRVPSRKWSWLVVSPLPSTPAVVSRARSHRPFWDPGLPCGLSQLLPSALSAGLWEVPTTEAVYSGVHPRLERAQRGDGSGEEVHSEVGFPAGPPPHLACQPALLSSPEILAPLIPRKSPLVFRGPEHLIFWGAVTWVLPTIRSPRHLLAV